MQRLMRKIAWQILWHMPVKENSMNHLERHVSLFRNGRSQAIRIPKEFELEGEEAIIRKEGDRLIVEPVIKNGLLSVLSQMKLIEEKFSEIGTNLQLLDDIVL